MTAELHKYDAVAVIVSASESPRVSSVPAGELPEVRIDGQTFVDSGEGDWLGFYDWLRTVDGRIVGARIWLDIGLGKMPEIGNCLNVRLLHGGQELQIFFDSIYQFDAELSCDQDFGGNQLMLGQNSYLFTFNAPAAQQKPTKVG